MKTKTLAKRLAAILLTLALVLTAACAATPNDAPREAEFNAFLSDFLVDALLQNPSAIHMTFKHPENFGFPEEYEAHWGDGYVYPTDERLTAERALLDRFEGFERGDLTAEQQIAYDIIAYDVETYYTKRLKFFYYDEPLASAIGEHVGLPLALTGYIFQTERDIENYLKLCEDTGRYFAQILAFEREKARQGLFMTDRALDTLLAECRGFAERTEDNMLITEFAQNLEHLEEPITPEQAGAYAARNRDAVLGSVLPAYAALIEGMEALRGSGVNDQGLAGLPLGKEYAAFRLGILGVSRAPEELIGMLDDAIRDCYSQISENLLETPAILNQIMRAELPVPGETGEEILAFLREAAADDFPALPGGTAYTLRAVDASQEDAARPASYYIPQIDNTSNSVILVNNKYVGDGKTLFAITLAHEGYPGHLQQFVSVYAREDVSAFRKANLYYANAEGWAQYAQTYAFRYLTDDGALADTFALYYRMDLFLQERLDLGICYEGWSVAQLDLYYKTVFGGSADEDTLRALYEMFTDGPLTASPYALGQLELETLRARFPAVSDLDFHTDYLGFGSIPCELMARYMTALYTPN
jgi:uncharacterized protein (DUF885 family)